MPRFDIWCEELRPGCGAVRLSQYAFGESFPEAVRNWWRAAQETLPKGLVLDDDALGLHEEGHEKGYHVSLFDNKADAEKNAQEAIVLNIRMKDGGVLVNALRDWDPNTIETAGKAIACHVKEQQQQQTLGSAIILAAVLIIEDNVGKECADKVADIIRQYTEKIIRENEMNPQGMTFYINNDGKHIS